MAYADTHTPAAYAFSVASGHSWTLTLPSSEPLWYLQLANVSANAATVQLNGATAATFSLAGNSVQIFNGRDVDCYVVKITNPTSGAGTTVVDVVVSYTNSVPVITTT